MPTALTALLRLAYIEDFSAFVTQDADEFCVVYIDALSQASKRAQHLLRASGMSAATPTSADHAGALQRIAQRKSTILDSHVDDMFLGAIKTTMRCSSCTGSSITFNEFTSLKIELPSRGLFDLAVCPQLVGSSELVRDADCHDCTKQGKYKRDELVLAPRVLSMQMKRLISDGQSQHKNRTPVAYPLVLDLRQHVSVDSESAVYHLCAVCRHLGDPAAGDAGHFVTVVRRGDNWFNISDAVVQPIGEITAFKDDPDVYVLMYVRADCM